MWWSELNYPVSMKSLPEAVRSKAIEFANDMRVEGPLEDEILIAAAITRAKAWIESANSKAEDINPQAEVFNKDNRYVIPYGEKEWAVKPEGRKKVEYVFRSKTKAVAVAKAEAKKWNASVIIQNRKGKSEKTISYRGMSRGRGSIKRKIK